MYDPQRLAREEKSQETKKFLNSIRTGLRALDEVSTKANREKLYIGLLKEGVRKDTKK